MNPSLPLIKNKTDSQCGGGGLMIIQYNRSMQIKNVISSLNIGHTCIESFISSSLSGAFDSESFSEVH